MIVGVNPQFVLLITSVHYLVVYVEVFLFCVLHPFFFQWIKIRIKCQKICLYFFTQTPHLYFILCMPGKMPTIWSQKRIEAKARICVALLKLK